MGKVFLTGDSPALWLNYQTDISIDDVPLLRKEIIEIWPVFKINADKSGLTNAVISAHEPAQGSAVRTDRSYNFVFQKSSDGKWKLL